METVLWSRPEAERAGTPLLVMMHGYGRDEARMAKLFDRLPPEFSCAALRGPKIIGDGYGWFLREIAGADARYAWGYGGQMLYVVPSLGLTVAMTSDDSEASARTGHRDALHGLVADIITSARRHGVPHAGVP